MQILADANSSRNRNPLRNWMYPKTVDIKMYGDLLPVSLSLPLGHLGSKDESEERILSSRAHLFFIHSHERVDFRARDSSRFRSRTSRRKRGRESRRECSLINKEQRRDRKRAGGLSS